MNRRVQALRRIDMLRQLFGINEDDAPIHLGQNTHLGEFDDIQSNLFSTQYLDCNVLNCSQLRLEVLIACLSADEALDVYSLEEIQLISDNIENYLHEDTIFQCMYTSLRNQLDYMLRLNDNPQQEDIIISESESDDWF